MLLVASDSGREVSGCEEKQQRVKIDRDQSMVVGYDIWRL